MRAKNGCVEENYFLIYYGVVLFHTFILALMLLQNATLVTLFDITLVLAIRLHLH